MKLIKISHLGYTKDIGFCHRFDLTSTKQGYGRAYAYAFTVKRYFEIKSDEFHFSLVNLKTTIKRLTKKLK